MIWVVSGARMLYSTLAIYSCGISEYTLCAHVCRHLQHKSSVISVDSGNTLCLKMQNRFYSTCRVRGSCFRLVSPRSRSRILARGLQVAYGAGLWENEISDPFTPILRPLQYHIFSVGSRCHGVVTPYPHSTFIVFE